jgi:hypothetical protein
MLVEYGARIPRDYDFTTLLRHAVNVESRELYRFLLTRGGLAVSRTARVFHATEIADTSSEEEHGQVTS